MTAVKVDIARDSRTDTLYLKMLDKDVEYSVEPHPGCVVDISKDGNLVGVRVSNLVNLSEKGENWSKVVVLDNE